MNDISSCRAKWSPSSKQVFQIGGRLNSARVIRVRRAGHRHSEPSTPRSIAYCISLGGDCVVYLLLCAGFAERLGYYLGKYRTLGLGYGTCARDYRTGFRPADTSSDHHIRTFLVAGRHRRFTWQEVEIRKEWDLSLYTKAST